MSVSPEHFTQASDIAQRLQAEIARSVVGQTDAVRAVLASLLAGGHVLLEGMPGLGKTLLVKALAKTFSGQFARIQFTPDLMPADVVGHAVFDLKNQSFTVRRGPIFTHLLLADEINRAPAKTQSALLEVMQERQVTIEGESHPLDAPYMVLATQNPIEQEGTYPLPEAQLDRFLVKVLMDYPSAAEELELARLTTQGRIGDALDVAAVNTLIKPETVATLQQVVAQVRVDEQVLDYAVRIVRATRDWPGIGIGAGPRGAIALIRLARAWAVLEQRDFVTPDDVKQAALPVLRHRIAITPEAELEGLDADRLLRGLLEQLPAPRA
ncbi:AAA family ATPase [Chitinilyticum aquatile]|uniref:AAA family ATPase n=1 Tax=Chitinilyticum aquatile TaxID=362520 RepID=UPI00042A3469|nr:MoxR family ATPase [Chitinilyticum aquatile]